MKKFITTFLFTLAFTTGFSQVTISYNESKSIDSLTSSLDKSSLTSDILYNRVTSFAKLASYNTTENNTSNRKHFEQSFSELYRASKQEKLMTVEQLRNEYSFDKNKVEIGILNTVFHTLNYNNEDESLNGVSLDTIQNKFLAIPNKEIFIAHNKTIIAPLKSYAKGENITYIFKNSLIFNINPDKNIAQLTANFGAGVAYTIIQDGVLITNEITVNYSEQGNKELIFDIVYSDNTTLTTKASIYTSPEPEDEPYSVTATIPFPGYEDGDIPLYGSLEYRVFYHTGGSTLQKPLIFIDGFDPLDKRKILRSEMENPSDFTKPSIEELISNYQYPNDPNPPTSFLNELQDKGYDVIIVNHPIHKLPINGLVEIDGGADYMERNAMAHIELYKEINGILAENGSTEQLVIVGPSMGGQISRYALAYMEKEYEETGLAEWNHNCRLWVSIDSPHQGANIPIGSQANIFFLGYTIGNEDAKYMYDNKINSIAGKQMLKTQFSHSYPGRIDINGHIFATGSNFTVPSFYTQYYNNLHNNGVAGSNGYPMAEDLRKVAMVNGSLTGNTNGSAGDEIFHVKGYKRIFWKDRRLFRNRNWFIKRHNQNNKIFHGEGADAGWIYFETFETSIYFTNPYSNGSMDAVSGGMFDTQKQIWDVLEDALQEKFGDNFTNPPAPYRKTHTFMPTHSTLDTSGFSNWNQPINHNLVCSSQTPFDSYFGEAQNTGHVTFTSASKEWFFQELDGEEPLPSNYYEVDAEITEISGDNIICENETKTYTIDINDCEFPNAGSFEWSTSSNLTIISSIDTQIEVQSTEENSTPLFIKATFDSGEVITKHLIGKPNINLHFDDGNPSFIMVSIEGIGVHLDLQNITDISWEKIDGDASLLAIDGESFASIHGPEGSSINVKVTVTNSCGDTEIDFFEEIACPEALRIQSIPEHDNLYQVIIDCDDNPNDPLYISASEIYDIYGYKVQDLTPNVDELNIEETGTTGDVRIIKVEHEGKVGTKRVIVK